MERTISLVVLFGYCTIWAAKRAKMTSLQNQRKQSVNKQKIDDLCNLIKHSIFKTKVSTCKY